MSLWHGFPLHSEAEKYSNFFSAHHKGRDYQQNGYQKYLLDFIKKNFYSL